MLSDATRAVMLEALEYRKRKAIESGDFTVKEAEEELAELNAAIAEVNAQAGWVPVADGEYGECDTIKLKHNGSFVTIHSAYGSGSSRLTAMMPLPDNVRLCRRIGSQSEAQDGKP